MDTNKELLDQAIESSLTDVQDYDVCSEPHKAAFKEAMEAYDRRIELAKIEEKISELKLKELELELKKQDLIHKEKTDKWTKTLRYIEVIGVPFGLLFAEALVQNVFIEKLCTWEKDYTFASGPGKRVSDVINIFRRKR